LELTIGQNVYTFDLDNLPENGVTFNFSDGEMIGGGEISAISSDYMFVGRYIGATESHKRSCTVFL
jgi:hypothetical protein